MTPTNFFKGRALVVGLLFVLGIGFLIYRSYYPPTVEDTKVIVSETAEGTGTPLFMWKYEQDDSLNLDGTPRTNIILEARYANGAFESKRVDTQSGGCNDLPESEADSVPNSSNAQCYSAGLGYQYKIVKGERSYLVMRKEFEEGSPDYNPPVQAYEIISEFPLFR